MKETAVVTALLRELKLHGFFWKASDKFHAGIPDIIGCVNGRFVAIEVKIDSNKPTPLQTHYLRQIEHNGGASYVITYKNKDKTYNTTTQKTTKKGIIEWILSQLNQNA